MSLIALILNFIIQLRSPSHVSIAEITKHRYGEAALRVFRISERTAIKYHKAIVDLIPSLISGKGVSKNRNFF